LPPTQPQAGFSGCTIPAKIFAVQQRIQRWVRSWRSQFPITHLVPGRLATLPARLPQVGGIPPIVDVPQLNLFVPPLLFALAELFHAGEFRLPRLCLLGL